MRYRNLVLIGSCCCLLSTLSLGRPNLGTLCAQESDELVRIVKIYAVADLCGRDATFADPGVQSPGTGLLDPAKASGGTGAGMGGGMGGMGGGSGEGLGGMGGGMGGGGAGGMFAVPATPPQMSMGMGGWNWPTDSSRNGVDLYPLIELLEQVIQREDFESGQLHAYQGQLVARQTEGCHAEIAAFLSQLRSALAQEEVIKIQWAALAVDAGAMQQLLPNDDQTLWQRWIDERAVAFGTLSALNGYRVFSSSGEHRNLVIGVTPVVGSFQDGLPGGRGGSTGYQPQVVKPILGWLAEVRPVISADPTQPGLLHVGISQIVADPTPLVPVVGAPDRGNLPTFQAVGTVKVKADTWTVLGGLAALPAENDSAPKHVILVRWSR